MKNRKTFNLLGIFVLMGFILLSQVQAQKTSDRWNSTKRFYYTNKWVEVIPGDLPIVISVPHGGITRPLDIPKRACEVSGQGKMVTTADRFTIATARAIRLAFKEKYGKTPFIVISNLARSQVDQNRRIELAACGNPLAEQAWKDFHNAIDTALAIAVEKFGYSLYIDLHGHGHKNQRLELGYSLTAKQLTTAFGQEGNGTLSEKTSLNNLLKKDKSKDLHTMLWGDHSFGTLLYDQGTLVTPSKQDPHPQKGEAFFSGGYNSRRYTSAKHPHVFGWQIECNYKGIRDTKDNRRAFAQHLAVAYGQYIEKNIASIKW